MKTGLRKEPMCDVRIASTTWRRKEDNQPLTYLEIKDPACALHSRKWATTRRNYADYRITHRWFMGYQPRWFVHGNVTIWYGLKTLKVLV